MRANCLKCGAGPVDCEHRTLEPLIRPTLENPIRVTWAGHAAAFGGVYGKGVGGIKRDKINASA